MTKAIRWSLRFSHRAGRTTAASDRSSSAWRTPTLMSTTPTRSKRSASTSGSPWREDAATPIAAIDARRRHAGSVGGLNRSRSSGRVEGQRSQLDALARQHFLWGGRILEGRVSGEPRLIFGRIVALDQDRLVDPHLGHVEPAMRRVVCDAVGLAGPIAID